MIDRYHYGIGNTISTDRIGYRRQTPVSDLVYSIGDKFNNYNFSQPALDFDTAVCERLKQLKESGKYLRLWFSGGKDSLIALNTAKKLNIKFDEIVVVKNWILGPHLNISSITEIMDNAVYWIEHHRDELQGTKITYIDFTDKEYELVFQDPSWIKYSNLWYMHIAYAPNLYYRFVEPVRQFLDPIDNRYDILGSIHPNVWWDDEWKFCYVDTQFQQYSWHTQENFLTSPDFPELVHSYVKTVGSELKKMNLFPKRFEDNIVGDTNQRLRNIRDLVPSYQFEVRQTNSMYPKVWSDPWRPTNDLFWRINMTYKTALNAMILFNDNPRKKFFDDYIKNTDWKQLHDEMDFGGILTKEFSIG